MKLSTRILSIIMAFAMIVSSMVVVASAEDAASVAKITVAPGELNEDGLLPVEIKIENTEDKAFVHLQLDLEYDSETFQIANIVDSGVIGALDEEGNNPLATHNLTYDTNKCHLMWSDGATKTPHYFLDETVVATVYFAPVEGKKTYAYEEYEFVASYSFDDKYIVDYNLNSIEFEIVNGTYVVAENTDIRIFLSGDSSNKDVEGSTFELTQEETLDFNPNSSRTNVEGSENWTYEWTSSDTTIAKVTPNGGEVVPTGLKAGGVEITVTYYDAEGTAVASASVTVNVTFTEGYEPPAIGGEVVPTIILKDMELMVGETAAIDAIIVPADAEVAYTSDNEAVTVDAVTGELTAVSEGSATITAKIGETTATCTVTVVPAVAKIGDTKYKSVADALAAATSGQTVTMIGDSKEGAIVVKPGVSLNVDTFTLEADYIVAVTGACVYGTVPTIATTTYKITNKGGRLKVAQDALVLPEEPYRNDKGQGMIPMWDSTDGNYFFSLALINTDNSASAARGLFIDEEAKTIKFGMRPNYSARVGNVWLTDGADDNGFQILIRASWSTDSGDAKQDFVFNNKLVGDMVGSSNGILTIVAYDKLNVDLDSFSVVGMIITDSGAVIAGESWTTAEQIG